MPGRIDEIRRVLGDDVVKFAHRFSGEIGENTALRVLATLAEDLGLAHDVTGSPSPEAESARLTSLLIRSRSCLRTSP
jgi:hypothetical protein